MENNDVAVKVEWDDSSFSISPPNDLLCLGRPLSDDTPGIKFTRVEAIADSHDDGKSYRTGCKGIIVNARTREENSVQVRWDSQEGLRSLTTRAQRVKLKLCSECEPKCGCNFVTKLTKLKQS